MPADEKHLFALDALLEEPGATVTYKFLARHLDISGRPHLDEDTGRKVLAAFYKMESKDPDQYPVTSIHSTSPR